MYKLTIEDDEGKTVVVPLARDEISIGRKEGNTIRLTEQNISRQHARFVRKNGKVLLEDLGSFNGVKVNGVRISESVPVNNGDQILIGDYKLLIKAPEPAFDGATTIEEPARQFPDTTLTNDPAVAPAPATGSAPNIPDPIEGAPTIPVRTLADQGLAAFAGIPAAEPARLLVISTDLAGTKFPVDRASLVIGRTPENDVVIAHKSISRHHAKVIQDGESYVLLDLDSANGVRVNGMQHERIQLANGDIIELGHVRMRFVTGDNKNDFSAAGSSSRGAGRKLIVAGLAVAAAAAAIFMVLRPGAEPAQVGLARPEAVPPAVPPAPVAPVTAPPTATPAAEPAAFAAAPKETPAPVVETADPHGAEQFAILKRSFENKQYDPVLAIYATIAESSAYHVRALPLYHEARAKIIARHLEAAKKSQRKGKCDPARAEAELALALDPQDTSARTIIDGCSKVAVAATTPPKAQRAASPPPARPAPQAAASRGPAKGPTRTVARASASATGVPTATPTASQPATDPDVLLKDAQESWLRGQFAAAIDAAQRALKLRPNQTRAYQIIAVCSCSLKDAQGATRAYEKLDDKNKRLVRSLCQKSGIAIE